ncbi:hypothetical protein [Noviherbaspirillum sp. L7-7A]|uniref:hypothetical protein n=1 Tax=Noviherbaspirillum sp. L7-7A TaxID=2850560 RepID=UPI0020119555|nr:hypothetical protein [Noviherbaspirillum sp. L7-7A]
MAGIDKPVRPKALYCPQAGPQHHQHATAVIVGVDAGAAGFHHAAAQVLQTVEVEPLLRRQAAAARRRARAEHAVAAHHLQGAAVARDQVVAVRVERILVQAVLRGRQVHAHRMRQRLAAQALHFADILRRGSDRQGNPGKAGIGTGGGGGQAHGW